MPKKVVKMVKLQVPAAKATPAPPVGPALGQAGVNIMPSLRNLTHVPRNKLASSFLLRSLYSKIVPLLS